MSFLSIASFFRPCRGSLAALLVAAALASATPTQAQGGPALVATEEVRSMSFHRQVQLVGRSEARAESEIVAQVEGPVLAVDVREGQRVRRGESLIRIDPVRIRLLLAAKRAEEAQAAAEAERAAKDLLRSRDLFQKEIIPEHLLDQARATAVQAEERHKQLQAERELLEIDLERTTIRAPFSGYTVARLVEVGEWVDPGTPVYELVDVEILEVTVDLPERHFGEVELGSPVEIRVTSTDAAPLQGEVTGIAPRASATTHTFPVKVSVPNREGRLASGMLVRATLELRGTFDSLAVSKDAVVRSGERTSVFTVEDGKAVPIEVEVTSRNGAMLAVTSPRLAEGMPVVVRGNERIFPGSPVRVDGSGAGNDGGEGPQETGS